VKQKKQTTKGFAQRRPLRKQAEEVIRKRPPRKSVVTNHDLRRLVHELEVHQVELKLQNEELRNAQLELATTRDRYTGLYDFAPLAYVTVDRNGKIFEGNLMAAALLGVERRNLFRADLTKFLTSESQDDWYLHRQAAFTNDTKQVCEIQLRRPDGVLLSVRAESIGFGAGNERHCRTAFLDITEKKKAEEEREHLLARIQAAHRELEAATQAKDRFLAMVSHELRTPLTPIMGWSRILRNKPVKDFNLEAAAESIERNAKMLTRLVDDLLDVSRNIVGKTLLVLKPVELSSIINAAIETVRPDAEAKGVQIQTQFDQEECRAAADPERLQQVVCNLLSNAVKFTPHGGNVHTKVRRAARVVEIIVSDTGEGIPEAFLPFIFDPFSQADESRVKRQKGLGLGLAIVRQIVELHAGTVQVESTEGKGATFTIRIPVTSDRAA
jgi:PAS domain S-box-containing protein